MGVHNLGVLPPTPLLRPYLVLVSQATGVTEPAEQRLPRRKGRPRDASADERILAAAAELILQRGYDNMTVDEVAAMARAGKATVYRRWSGKEDLAFAALEQLYSAEFPVPDTGSIVGDLRVAITQTLEFVGTEQGRAYLRMTIAESLRDKRLGGLYAAAYQAQQQGSRAMFDRAIARGELRADIRIDFAVSWLTSVLVLRTTIDEPQPALDEVDDMIDFLMRGISA
ncbi:MAG: transcriptional regulator, TetR family [Marmoricola sp.]|nr:transcriptional regulator, TetR family [Marmoricola sp.]